MFGIVVLGIGLALRACGGRTTTLSPVPPDEFTRIEGEINQIFANADYQVIADILVTSRSRVIPNVRLEFSCQGVVCAERTNAVDPNQAPQNLVRFDPASDIRVGVRHGINEGKTGTTTDYQDPNSPANAWSIDYQVYGGWLSESLFGVTLGQWSGQGQFADLDGTETLNSYSTGSASGSNPVVTGTASWEGLLLAIDQAALDRSVNGKASLTFDMADPLDATFTQVRGVRVYPDMSWTNVPVANGTFTYGDGGDFLAGTFYGANHEEVGGVFEQNQLIGAFGARRP